MTGTIRKRGNAYELVISLGYDAQGKQRRVYRTVHVATKKEAQAKLIEFILEQQNQINSSDITFADFSVTFMAKHKNKLGPSAIDSYQNMLDNRIVPCFGNNKLSDIKTEYIMNFINFLSSEAEQMNNTGKLSAETVRKHYRLLHLMFRKAVLWGFLKTSPCERMDHDLIPKGKNRHHPIFNEKDLKRFLQLLDQRTGSARITEIKLFIYILLTCGCRRGEAGALAWHQIDLLNKKIEINRGLKTVRGKTVGVGDTKNISSIRTVFFDEHLKNLFELHRQNQLQWLKDNKMTNTRDLVFFSKKITDSRDTELFRPAGVYLWLKRFCKRNGLPHINLHSLRAQCATLAASVGLPINLVAAMLGHSNLSTTSIYVHDLLKTRQDATQPVLQYLNNIRESEKD